MNTEELRIITLERLNQLLSFEEAYNNNKYVSKISCNMKQIQTIKPDDALKEIRDENERLTHLISRYSDENRDLEKELKKSLEHYKNNKLASLNIIEDLGRQLNREKNKSLFDRIFKK